MACHIKNRLCPNLVFIGLILLGVYSVQMQVSGSPIPGEFEETAQNAVNTAKTTWESIKDFFRRMINTFTGNVDDKNAGLSHLELALVVVGALLVFMFFFCCIGFFVCACVKELICCICCCSCCRD